MTKRPKNSISTPLWWEVSSWRVLSLCVPLCFSSLRYESVYYGPVLIKKDGPVHTKFIYTTYNGKAPSALDVVLHLNINRVCALTHFVTRLYLNLFIKLLDRFILFSEDRFMVNRFKCLTF